MKKTSKKDEKAVRGRDRDLMIYLWLLQHTWEGIETSTPMQAWSARETVWEGGR